MHLYCFIISTLSCFAYLKPQILSLSDHQQFEFYYTTGFEISQGFDCQMKTQLIASWTHIIHSYVNTFGGQQTKSNKETVCDKEEKS